MSVGTLYVVAMPIGQDQDLSPRARQILQSVDYIAAEDTRSFADLLLTLGARAPRMALHDHNERARCASLITLLQEGSSIALISDAGTPLISDPGYLLVSAAHDHQIPVVPLPGPCAAIAALSACGLPTHAFHFIGFLPRTAQARQTRLKELARYPETLIFYEAPHRINATLADVVSVLGAQRLCCIARELSKTYEQICRASAQELLHALDQGTIPVRGEFVLIVSGLHTPEGQSVDTEELHRIFSLLSQELPMSMALKCSARLVGLSKKKSAALLGIADQASDRI